MAGGSGQWCPLLDVRGNSCHLASVSSQIGPVSLPVGSRTRSTAGSAGKIVFYGLCHPCQRIVAGPSSSLPALHSLPASGVQLQTRGGTCSSRDFSSGSASGPRAVPSPSTRLNAHPRVSEDRSCVNGRRGPHSGSCSAMSPIWHSTTFPISRASPACTGG